MAEWATFIIDLSDKSCLCFAVAPGLSIWFTAGPAGSAENKLVRFLSRPQRSVITGFCMHFPLQKKNFLSGCSFAQPSVRFSIHSFVLNLSFLVPTNYEHVWSFSITLCCQSHSPSVRSIVRSVAWWSTFTRSQQRFSHVSSCDNNETSEYGNYSEKIRLFR